MFNKISVAVISSYFFACAIPHAPALRYALLGFLVLLGLIGLVRKEFQSPPRSLIINWLIVFAGIALVSALQSPYLTESLDAFRKEYLPPLLIIIFASCLKQSERGKILVCKYIIYSVIAGFCVKTVLAFWDGAINQDFVFSVYSNKEVSRYVSFYAVESVLYVTFTYMTLLFLTQSRLLRLVLATVCLFSLYMILVSGVRSSVVATAIPFIILTVIKFRNHKQIFTIFLSGIFIIGAIVALGGRNVEIDRYISLLDSDSYMKKDSDKTALAGRYYIWEGVWDISKKRPLLGFGPGWQKLPEVAHDSGMMGEWAKNQQEYNNSYKIAYFSFSRGQCNPHNLVMQIIFETGVLGLIAYFGLFFSLIRCPLMYKLSDRVGDFLYIARWTKILIVPYAIAYFLINVTNGLLFHNTLLAIMLIIVLQARSKRGDSGCSEVLDKERCSNIAKL